MPKTLKKKHSVRTDHNNELTLWKYFEILLPRLTQDPSVPRWPPDVFALCMSILTRTGAYSTVLRNWPPHGPHKTAVSDWATFALGVAEEWRHDWFRGEVPNQIVESWAEIASLGRVEIRKLRSNVRVCQILLQLAAIADEASVGFGVPGEPGSADLAEVKLHSKADALLGSDSGSTLCDEINTDLIRVLPKMRTPQTGLTARSLSHNLALIIGNEMTPHWKIFGTPLHENESLRLLVIPWPFAVVPAQFEATEPVSAEMQNMPEDFGFFTFRQTGGVTRLLRIVQRLWSKSTAALGRIDGVVFPEAALSPYQHAAVRRWVLKQNAFLIAGVGTPSRGRLGHGLNCVRADFPGISSLEQKKHHRWRLDELQVKQYGLGGLLHPEKTWWEHINIDDRQLLFLALENWLVLSVLICEDLARPDPVGDVVRAVGPNLVIALLMDGPQLKERWGARYATALADDPGCSVLTVTSTGMAELSRPAQGQARSRVIALWKDATSGAPVEIELPSGNDAVVLSLTVRYMTEWTADGRSDDQNAGYPQLSGIYPIRLAT